MLDINAIDLSKLAPERRDGIILFPDPNLEILKIDLYFDAGAAYQPKLLVAGAANALFTEGTPCHTAHEIAEFLEYRGVEIDRTVGQTYAGFSLFLLPRYANELLPLLHELVEETSIPDEEFAIYMNKRRQSLQANLQKTSCMARNLFFRSLFPRPHPYGDYALPVDADKVSAQDVRDFFHRCYRWNTARLVISGACHHLHWDKHPWLAETGLANTRQRDEERSFATTPTKRETLRHPVPGAVQSTIRIGRLLPFAWNDMQHARFLILNAILGGYFGSRLMSNLREDKGYTYGIYSRVQIMRGATVFSLSTDVNAETTDNALKEIYGEMRRLREEPVPTDELETVKNYLAGEFLRGIDGVFERSERFIQQEYALVDDRLDANYLQALSSVTPQQLQELACEFLREDELTEVVAGR